MFPLLQATPVFCPLDPSVIEINKSPPETLVLMEKYYLMCIILEKTSQLLTFLSNDIIGLILIIITRIDVPIFFYRRKTAAT